VNFSCLFGRKGLPEPNNENKQHTRRISRFFICLQQNKKNQNKPLKINLLKTKIYLL